MGEGIYDRGLERHAANHVPLTPLDFLERSAQVYPDKLAVVDGERRFSYAQFRERCHRLASALAAAGVGRGDTVTVMAPNGPAMLEAHYGVPLAGAVLNALNFRLDSAAIAFILEHAETKVLLTDTEFAQVIRPALGQLGREITVIDIVHPEATGTTRLGALDYEAFLDSGDPEFAGLWPDDEWQALALNYTSGTTGNPKGVVYHHRGAFLNAMGNLQAFSLDRHSVYLWTLPMFHCNGWTYTWAVTAASGTHVCLRAVDPARIFALIDEHGVNRMCGAPIVLNLLIHAPDEVKRSFPQTVRVATGGAAPPSAVISAMERMGFAVLHLYGLTESYGPATLCAWQDAWDGLDAAGKAEVMARQGVRYPTLSGLRVVDQDSGAPVPADGETLGELCLRGNTVMKGYLKNPDATAEAFRDGWFHTGDLAVVHPDGYIEVRDRSKDIIITGGENVSSLEVESVLYRHPQVMEAAVVARPDDRWG
ncbi:MAG: AMP-binding protein, partial [Gammaproteobacteria bacterium]|nr:AMP-binding protein [Gammaproteobacteria bacterium]